MIIDRPETTLFLLTSIDGKISTGDSDVLDVDRDYPNILGLKDGLQQYYDIEKTTDLFSLNTGRVFAKIGINERTGDVARSPVHFVIVDSAPHLNKQGIRHLAQKATELIIATTNETHPAVAMQSELSNLHVVVYPQRIDFSDLFRKLKTDFGAEKLTVQSGGTLNATLIREGLIDRALLVIAPALIGGNNTPSMMGGESLHVPEELSKIKTLELVQARPLEHSYLLLEYRVVN